MSTQVRPGYKLTEAGTIPENWSLDKLGDIATLERGKFSARPRNDPKFFGGDFPFIQTGDITNSNGYITTYLQTLNESGLKVSKLFPRGTLFFTIAANIGDVAFASFDSACPDSLIGITPTNTIDSLWLYQSLKSQKKVFEGLATQNAQLNINLEKLRPYILVVPPLPEQRAIATALSDTDALVFGLDQLIAKKRGIKQAAMHQLLTGQKRLPTFNAEWDNVMVSSVISNYFSGPSPSCQERNIHGNSEWGVLKTTAATKENGWDWKKHKALPEAYWGRDNIELQAGDVIVTKAGPRHRVGVAVSIDYTPRRLIPSGKMIALRPNRVRIVPLMLAAAISAKDAQIYLDQRSTGMAESQVNFENIDLLSTPIRIPSIIEQEAIACVLSDMDIELANLESRRQKALQLKQGMIQELLTGRIRLV